MIKKALIFKKLIVGKWTRYIESTAIKCSESYVDLLKFC